ncbi:HAD-IIB family hydrolase [Rubinisphaera margarita]|uniref:HAD-IIB family hydrolase n=1 Tax=Rubinisphaera margarita TaxID=2909586 RepID=UPI001EE9A44E|nr:HAD-IIB family hydrolase [Rubinisphaera margarita]MCG6157335.1 HAD family hydrolase [Rubinisphaera margarita]
MYEEFPAILATDLDGTLIPLENDQDNVRDLQMLRRKLQEHRVPLVYVTGRHLESVLEKQREHQLPQPEWIVCDVGTTICERSDDDTFKPLQAYMDYQDTIVQEYPRDRLQAEFQSIGDLVLQEEVKQGPFKLSYYVNQEAMPATERAISERLHADNVPWTMIASIDPFNGDGLIDLLPREVSKAHALQWWADRFGIDLSKVVFAGDSGNDYAAFISGFRAILVNNTDARIVQQVREEHERRGLTSHAYHANARATSGVLEGCHAYGVFPHPE